MEASEGAEGEGLSDAALERGVAAGARLIFDTSALIAYFDAEEEAHPAAVHIVEGLVRPGRNVAVVSVVTATEVLVRPYRAGRHNTYGEIVRFLRQFPHLQLREVDFEVAERAARVRAQHALRTPDALIVATGLVLGIADYVTNDEQWSQRLRRAEPPLRVHYLGAYLQPS